MSWLGRRRRVAFAASLACLAVAISPGAARAGQVTLSGDGPAVGTLRGEIANATAGETITFAPGVNPVVTLGQITIPTSITLVGNGSGQTTITGPSTDRVFRIQAGSAQTVTIQDLKITGGHAPPGSSPGATGGNGGAILQETAHLFIDGVVFDNNSAGAGAAGSTGSSGGIGTGGAGGAGGAGGQGGAIYAFGVELDVRDSIFRNNFAGNGGAGGTGGTGSFEGGTGGPGGHGGAGGAIAIHSFTEITNTTFEDNSGGTSGTGGPPGSSQFGGNGGAGSFGGQGGAIWQDPLNPISPFLQVVNSTFNHNFAGDGGTGGNGSGLGSGGAGGTGASGGALDVAAATVINSTLTANQAGNGGAGGNGVFGQNSGGRGGTGGAIQSNANLISSTIAGNRAGLGGPLGGPNGSGGGIDPGGPIPVNGTIIAFNFEGGFTTGPGANCNGPDPTGSFNLTFPGGTGCPGAVGDPLLGPLASNGGPTQTMALGAGSPAIDQVPVGTACSATDQRGIPRPQGPACDIGAYELIPPPVVAAPAAQQPVAKKKKKKCKKKKAQAKKKRRCKKKKKKR